MCFDTGDEHQSGSEIGPWMSVYQDVSMTPLIAICVTLSSTIYLTVPASSCLQNWKLPTYQVILRIKLNKNVESFAILIKKKQNPV